MTQERVPPCRAAVPQWQHPNLCCRSILTSSTLSPWCGTRERSFYLQPMPWPMPHPKTQRLKDPLISTFNCQVCCRQVAKNIRQLRKCVDSRPGLNSLQLWEMLPIALQARHFIGWNYAAVVFFHQQLTFRSFWRRLIPQMFTEKCCRPIEVHALKTRNAITTNGSILHIAGHSKPRRLGGQKSKFGSHHCTTTTTTICSPKLRPAPLVRLLLKVWCMVRFAKKKSLGIFELERSLVHVCLSRTPNSASCFAEEMDHRFHLESSQVDYAWNRFVGSPSSILSVIRYHVTSLQRSGSFSCAKEVNQQKTISQSQAMCRNQLHQPQGLKPRPPKKTPIPGLKIWILEKLYFWNVQNLTRIFHTTHAKKRLGMPNHPSQDASLSGKLMFTRTPRNVMSSWWWRLHPATGFTSQHITPPTSVVSFAKNYPCLNLDDCGMVFSRFLQKGFGPLMAMLMGPGLKKKNIRMAAGRLIHAPLEILKK